jgi:GLPGLI family protein
MKVNPFKTIAMLIAVLCSASIYAQNNSGTITYELKVNMHRNIPEQDAHMKNMIPEFNTSKEILYFNENESSYKPIEEDEDEDIAGGGGMQIKIKRPSAEVYTEVAKSLKIISQDIMGKMYLIQDTLKPLAWKVQAESKEILGFTCQKATYFDEERKQEITAWFTSQLRTFLGPLNFNSLPGTILQVDINQGERVFTAISKEFRALKKNELKAPSKGEKVSPAEFNTKLKAFQEQMKANGGKMIIRN